MFEKSIFSVVATPASSILIRTSKKKKKKKKQRTNGPVNAHLRSAVYTNVIENSPSIGADEALGPFVFQNNQYTVHTSFSLQITF